jgi:phenylacetic acid degradation operon negative regulatory protein
MGVSGNAMRVCLSRLKSAGFVQCDARGWYALGPEALALHEQVSHWRQLESQTRRWEGHWVAIHLDRLSGRQKARARNRARALELLGFADWREGLALRPDNLRGGVEAVRTRLHALGIDPRQPVFLLSASDTQLEELWDGAALDLRYHRGLETLRQSRERVAGLELEAAAAETFRVGGAALRQLAFDPLLPPPIVAVEARRRYARAVANYDLLGRRYWSDLLDAPLTVPRRREQRDNSTSMHIYSAQLEADR